MSGPKVYGTVLGIAGGLLVTATNPAGPVVFYGLLAVQSMVAAVIIWRRMGYVYLTAGLVLAALACGVLGGLAIGGWRPPFVPLAWLVAPACLLVGAAACYRMESKRRGVEWKAWRESIKRRSAIDILLFRHIPMLREGPSSGVAK